MARRSFSGDEKHRLPKGKKEPYRLWFEYLKLASDYPNITVDQDLYRDWGDVSGIDFDDWWIEHWRRLFATNPQTRLISSLEEYQEALRDQQCIVMRVSLTSSRKERLRDIDLVVNAQVSLQRKTRTTATAPAFAISSKRSINYATLRGMLRYLRFFKENNFDIDQATLAYHKWSSAWNDRVERKKLKIKKVYVPTFLSRLVKAIDEKKSSSKSATKGNKREYDELRNQARRMLRRGETVSKNVGEGRFPGSF